MDFDKDSQVDNKKALYGDDVSAIIHRSIDDMNMVLNQNKI